MVCIWYDSNRLFGHQILQGMMEWICILATEPLIIIDTLKYLVDMNHMPHIKWKRINPTTLFGTLDGGEKKLFLWCKCQSSIDWIATGFHPHLHQTGTHIWKLNILHQNRFELLKLLKFWLSFHFWREKTFNSRQWMQHQINVI